MVHRFKKLILNPAWEIESVEKHGKGDHVYTIQEKKGRRDSIKKEASNDA